MEKLIVPLCALIAQAMRMTPDEAKRLGQSYLKNPLHPILVRKRKDGKYDVLDGSNRAHGMRFELGEKSEHPVWCEVVRDDVSDEEIFLISALRKEPTAQEQVKKVERLAEMHPAWQEKEFAESLHLDPGHISRLRKVGKCLPVVREAFFAGVINLKQASDIGGLPDCEQHVLFAKMTLNGKPKERGAREMKIKRIRIPLKDGMVLVLTANKSLSMAEVSEIFGDVFKAAKAAVEKWDLSTWVKVMADQARKAGG